jgi:ParB-like chromosome segregation protein Spo0J
VAPVGDRYEVIAGNRRLRAAALAGLERVPAVVRPDLDEPGRLLVNLVENTQRVDLTAAERTAAVRQLAAAGLGLADIARGTGLSPETIARWVGLAGNPPLLRALDEGRIDLARAMDLAPVHDPGLLAELISAAPEHATEAFSALVQQRAAARAADPNRDERRLALVAERLARLEAVTPAGMEQLQRIIRVASGLVDRSRRDGERRAAVGAESSPADGPAA